MSVKTLHCYCLTFSPSESSDHQRAPTIDTWEPNESFTVPVVSQNLMSASSGLQQHSPDSVIRLQTELSNAKSKINYLTNELLKYQHRCEEMRYLEKEKNDTLLEYGKMKADLRVCIKEYKTIYLSLYFM